MAEEPEDQPRRDNRGQPNVEHGDSADVDDLISLLQEVTREDMLAWKFGEPDEETSLRVEAQLKIRGSFARKWTAEMQRKILHPENVDLGKLLLADDTDEPSEKETLTD